MDKSNIREKSRKFAVRIVFLSKHLNDSKHEFVLSKQILRSGTSIGANVVEAFCGISKKDFLAKMYIAFKESVETSFWLDILHDTDYLTDEEYESIYPDCVELVKLLSSITQTTKHRIVTGEYESNK